MSYLSDFLGSSFKEGMTEEEISSALENKISSMNDKHTSEVNGLKASISKSNSEAADYKKQLRAKQTEDEKKEADRQAEWERIVNRNKELEETVAITGLSGKLVSSGYDSALALDTAKAMLSGDFDKVLKNQSAFIEARDKSIKAKQMGNTPHPGSGEEGRQNYQKLYEEASAKGDMSAAAYYMRIMQE